MGDGKKCYAAVTRGGNLIVSVWARDKQAAWTEIYRQLHRPENPSRMSCLATWKSHGCLIRRRVLEDVE